jgi:hypothetical protein
VNLPAEHSARLRRCLAALALIFLCSLPAVTARIYATDEIQYFSYLRSLWFDRDVSFENEYRHFVDSGPGTAPGFYETNLERQTETGLRINYGTIGAALLWAPFYGLADLWVLASGSAPRDGFSQPYVTAVAYGSACYALAALALSMVVAVRTTGARPERAFAAAAAIWIGTPLLFYMYLAPVFAHATSAFSVALFVLTWLRVRQRWTLPGLATLGAVGALMVMVREQDASYLVGPAADFVWLQLRASRTAIGRAAIAAATAVVIFGAVFVPQALAYKSLNGYVGPSRLVTRKIYWYSPHAFEILLSPQHGFFFWTPLAVIAIAGLVVAIARLWTGSTTALASDPLSLRGIAIGLAVMFVGQIYLLGTLDSWTSAGAFGQRRFVGATVFLVIGLTALFDAVTRPWPRRLVTIAVVTAIYWNLALMAMFGTQLMSRQRLELGRNAFDAFVTVPQMAPNLAYRYLFDRRSFYRQQ